MLDWAPLQPWMPALSAGLAGLVLGLMVTAIARARWRQALEALAQQQQQTDYEARFRQHQLQEAQERLLAREREVETLRQRLQSSETHRARLETQRQADQQHFDSQLQLLQDNKEALKNEFHRLANDIFDAKGKRFSEQNQALLNGLLKPLSEQVTEFRRRVDDIHSADIRGRSELSSQLNLLRDLNTQLNQQAEDLTRALKGDKKLQGNWGELQVAKLLESAGLEPGREFEAEANFKDGEGNNKRPDFVVHLPDGKHLIIDSKVSLVDYQDAVNAEDEAVQVAALKRHVAATRRHMLSLSEKNYPQLTGMNAPDFVLMFMPIEPAYIAAFRADPNLFEEGFQRKVVIVTATTLLATLRTVANLWSLEKQNQNARELFDQAARIYDKMRIFAEKMERLGGQLNTAQRTWDDAWKSLSDGRGSLARQVERLQELGAPVRHKLPEALLNTGEDNDG
ncbi:MAG: DNA recombination protein RmuC [Saccharospirillum sp.]